MKLKIYSKKILATIFLSCSLVLPKAAHAFVWPAVAPAEIGLFVNNVISALSSVAAGNAQIQGYIATIQAIGDQVTMVCKYATDIGDAINSIEDSVEKLQRVTDEANDYITNTVDTMDDELGKMNSENGQMANTLKSAVEGAL